MSIIGQLHIPTNDEEWQDLGVCTQVDPDVWFPERGGSTKEAKKLCLRCPVREQCLQYALDNEERFGVWGGVSERDRRKLLRGERITASKIKEQPIRDVFSPAMHVRGCQCDRCKKQKKMRGKSKKQGVTELQATA